MTDCGRTRTCASAFSQEADDSHEAPAERSVARLFQRQQLWGFALIVASVLAAYLPALGCGYIWDDNKHVTENATLRTGQGLRKIWLEPTSIPQYYPLVHSTFWLEYRLWALDPLGYHLINVLLHAANALLVWRLLRLLDVPGAWWAAMVFALHPVHVESVAWITERKNVLSGLFYLSAAWFYLRGALHSPLTPTLSPEYRGEGAVFRPFLRRWPWYGVSLGLYTCALLSKTVTVTLPVALALVLWWKRGALRRRDWVPLLPMLVLAVPFALLTIWLEEHHVGAVGSDWQWTWVERCLIAGRALWFYAGKLFLPTDLTFIYPRWQINASAGWQYLYPLAAVLVILLLMWQRRMTGALAAVLFFVVTLSPALGFFDVFPMRYSFVADHFQYLASLGPLTLAVAVAAKVPRSMALQSRAARGIAAVVLGCLFVLTWRQCGIYQDRESLWGDTVAKNPACGMAHLNLGNALQERGAWDEAISHYRKALALDPDDLWARNNLANILHLQGRAEEAIAEYEAVLRADPRDALAHYNLATVLADQKRHDEAVEHYRESLRIRADNPLAHNNWGLLLAADGRHAEAIQHYEQALEIAPDYASAHVNWAASLQAQRSIEPAIEHYRVALTMEPDIALAHCGLATLYLQTGQRELAVQHARLAARLAPDDRQAQQLLQQALTQ